MGRGRITANSRVSAYAGLITVIVVWGVLPLVTLYFYQYFSATLRIAYTSPVCALGLLVLFRKKLTMLDRRYFMVAVPTGFFMGLANVLQKIGLKYTTPTHYAFLENLSVLVVPVLLIFFLKKKPGVLTVAGACLCLVSCFILSGMSADTAGSGLLGDALCGAAGLLYGVNIAATGAFAKKLYAPLYIMVQTFTEGTVALVSAAAFHVTGIEKLMFTFDWRIVLADVLIAFTCVTLCWLIRTNAMKHIDATVVAVMMPFSSVVTTVVSILMGRDTLSVNLVVGVVLGLIAIILSGLGEQEPKAAAGKSK